MIGGYLQYLPLKTKVTLKSPLEGQKLDPYHKPEEFLDRTVANLQPSAGWEANVQGNIYHYIRLVQIIHRYCSRIHFF